MKIAQISKPWEIVPPPKYGGVERIVAYLSKELAKNHDVTLFAPGKKSEIPRVKLKALFKEAQGEKGLDRNIELAQALDSVLYHFKKGKFDIIHAHSVDPILALAAIVKLPMLFTFHSVPSIPAQLLSKMSQDKVHFTFVSHAHRRSYPWIRKADVVHNGLPYENYPFSKTKKDYLAFVGPIRPEKGVVEAMEVARLSKTHLKIAGRIRPEIDEYYIKEIKPRLGKNKYVEFLGEITEKQRNQMLKYAKAFLFPISWIEPFSTSVLESLVVGTPVIAFNRGSVPEVIDDGKNGLIVENVKQMVKAIDKVDQIDPMQCRLTIEQRYNSKNMAKNYLRLYKKYIRK